jgi:hypothetical protein
MAIREINVQRFSVTSSRPFGEVVARIEAAVGHPDMREFWKHIAAAQTATELETVVHGVLGPSGLMEFFRLNHGEVLSKEHPGQTSQMLRLVVGNPLIMKQMARLVPDAGSYAPVTILVDERPDGVHLCYDRMASFLASYGNLGALRVAEGLDAKVEALLTEAAREK